MLLVFLPAWLAASRRGDAFFRSFWHMTPRDRERNYVAGLLAAGTPPRRSGAFELAPVRHDQLPTSGLTELYRAAAAGYSLIAEPASASSSLRPCCWSCGWRCAGACRCIGRHRHRRRRHRRPATGVRGDAAGALAEAARYVDDYLAFVALLPSIEQASEEARAAPMGFHQLDVDGVSMYADRPVLSLKAR